MTDISSAKHTVALAGEKTDGTLELIKSTSGALQTTTAAATVVDSNNSTTTTLNTGQTFTGTSVDVSNYSEITVFVYAEPATADGTLFFEFSSDDTNWDVSVPVNVDDPTLIVPLPLRVVTQYFRVRYTNGSTANQTAFRVQTLLHATSSKMVTRFARQTVSENEPVEMIRLATDLSTDIALGKVGAVTLETKFGRVMNIDAADAAVDIWAFADDSLSPRSNTKTFPAAADTIYLTSSSASDTAVTVTVEYIDSTGAAATASDVTLTGQTPVSIGATGLDVNRFFVSGATAPVGKVYASVGNDFTAGAPNDVTDVLAFMPIGNNQGMLSHYTVPLNTTLIMKEVQLHVSRGSGAAGSADVNLLIKENGGVARVRREWFPTTATPINGGVNGLTVPARSQITWRLSDVSDTDTNVSCMWTFQLVEDD